MSKKQSAKPAKKPAAAVAGHAVKVELIRRPKDPTSPVEVSLMEEPVIYVEGDETKARLVEEEIRGYLSFRHITTTISTTFEAKTPKEKKVDLVQFIQTDGVKGIGKPMPERLNSGRWVITVITEAIKPEDLEKAARLIIDQTNTRGLYPPPQTKQRAGLPIHSEAAKDIITTRNPEVGASSKGLVHKRKSRNIEFSARGEGGGVLTNVDELRAIRKVVTSPEGLKMFTILSDIANQRQAGCFTVAVADLAKLYCRGRRPGQKDLEQIEQVLNALDAAIIKHKPGNGWIDRYDICRIRSESDAGPKRFVIDLLPDVWQKNKPQITMPEGLLSMKLTKGGAAYLLGFELTIIDYEHRGKPFSITNQHAAKAAGLTLSQEAWKLRQTVGKLLERLKADGVVVDYRQADDGEAWRVEVVQ